MRLSENTVNYNELKSWMDEKSLSYGGFPKQILVSNNTFNRTISWFYGPYRKNGNHKKHFDARLCCVQYLSRGYPFSIKMLPDISYLSSTVGIHVDESLEIPTPQSLIECKAVLSKYLEQKKIELL